MKIRDQVLVRQTILVPTEESVSFLGPGLVLDHCDVILDCAVKNVVFSGVTMQGGSLTTKRRLNNYHFSHAHFQGVKFTGAFSGCDFGSWDAGDESSIADCDFTSAKLDGCRFLNCATESIVFPAWPSVTILMPSLARASVMRIAWPGRLAQLMDIHTDQDPGCVALTFDASRVAQKYACALDDFKPLLLGLACVKMSEAVAAGREGTPSAPK